MKKINFYLLLGSLVSSIVALILFTTDSSFFQTLNLFICSLYATSILFSSNTLLKYDKKIGLPIFILGVFMISIFSYSLLNAQIIKSTWSYFISIDLVFILLAINSILKNNINLISKISRTTFIGGVFLLIILLLTQQSNPIYFSIDFLFLLIGTITFIVSGLKRSN